MCVCVRVEDADLLHVFDAALKYLQTPGCKWIGSFPGVVAQKKITISHDFFAVILSRDDSVIKHVSISFHLTKMHVPSCASFPANVSQNPSDWMRMAKAMFLPQL